MATTTTTAHTLKFTSYKGGERRAEGQDGSVYSIKRIGDDTFETSVRMPGEKKFALLGGGNGAAARVVADQHYTNPDQGRAPSFVQEGSGTETVDEVLASIGDPEVEDVRNLVAATDEAAQAHVQAQEAASPTLVPVKTRQHAADKAKRAAHAQATGPVALDFQQWRDDTDQHRAKGARHAYRIVHTETGYYASQRVCAWTFIAGKCDTFEQAAELATRYEKGAKQLSHRKFQGMPYAQAMALLDSEAK